MSQLMLHKSNLWSENLSGYLPLASSESRNDGALLPAYASESGSGYGENHSSFHHFLKKTNISKPLDFEAGYLLEASVL
jgi:hypothetical protein